MAGATRDLLLIGMIGLALARPGWASLDDGLAAYDDGDYLAAYRELRPLADIGDPAAQHMLARMFFAGQGMPRDAAAALARERKAADLGEAAAQLDLVFKQKTAYDMPADMEQAAKWYGLAAQHGAPVAQYR